MGDASFGMAGMDIETATRSKVGTLTVILNNGVMTHYSDHMPFATEKWESIDFLEIIQKLQRVLVPSPNVETPIKFLKPLISS
ncbi:MAG: hypothetical protein CM1200mP7_2840 [Chloroflexota bacterium]|nr:MAG: hypothetical protein CM1200mP7_2840 [Chloroflexota bacterium]